MIDKDVPVLAIHGLIGCFSERLRSSLLNRQVIFPDMLGYGANKSSSTCGIEAQAEHFVCIANAAFGSEQKFVLIGHSIGGIVAHEITRRFPNRVARFFSIEGNLTIDDAFWTGSIARNGASEVESKLPELNSSSAIKIWLKTLDLEESVANRGLVNNWIERQTTNTLVEMSKFVYGWDYDSHLDSYKRLCESGVLRFVAGEHSVTKWDGLKLFPGGSKAVILIPKTHHMVMEREKILGEIISRNLIT